MKLNTKLAALLTLAGVALMPELAMADTLGQIANRVNDSIQGVGALAGAIGYAVSFFFLLGAIFKFKQYGDNPEQYPIRTPIFLVMSAVLGVYMTSVLTSGGETIFGSGAKSQGAKGGTFNSIGN